MVDPADRMLPCNHKLCSMCFAQVSNCPWCRKPKNSINGVMKEIIKWYEADEGYGGLRPCDDVTLANYLFHVIQGKMHWFSVDLSSKAKHISMYNPVYVTLFDRRIYIDPGTVFFTNYSD